MVRDFLLILFYIGFKINNYKAYLFYTSVAFVKKNSWKLSENKYRIDKYNG